MKTGNTHQRRHITFALPGLTAMVLSSATRAAGSVHRGRREARLILRTIWTDKDLLLAVCASAYFMLLEGLLLMNLIPYGMEHLGLSREQSVYLLVLAALGVGMGAWLADILSGANVEVGTIPLGALGLAGASTALGCLSASPAWVCLWGAMLGLSLGLFIVPVHALIRMRSPDRKRGQIAACSNILGGTGVLGAALLLYGLTEWFAVSSQQLFIVLALQSAVLAAVALWRLPDFFIRFVLRIITKCFYRIKTVGLHHIPAKGPALLVSNHVSWVDVLLISALGQRRIRFIMHKHVYAASRLKWFFRLMEVILISDTDPPKQIIRSIRQARHALDDGQLVCIFAEGRITRTGKLQAFKGGLERIVKGTDYPIIPMYLGGALGQYL